MVRVPWQEQGYRIRQIAQTEQSALMSGHLTEQDAGKSKSSSDFHIRGCNFNPEYHSLKILNNEKNNIRRASSKGDGGPRQTDYPETAGRDEKNRGYNPEYHGREK